MTVCPNGAIYIKDNIAHINKSKCIGCGLCTKTCPNKLITVKSITHYVDVACSSTDMGKVTNDICKKGCIGCKKCEKNCPSEAITVTDFCAHIDYDKCTGCGKCKEVCPRHVIL